MHMRPPRTIPHPQFLFTASFPHTPYCGLCGNDVKVGPGGVRLHLKDDESGELDPEIDRDHAPKSEDYHEED